MLVELVETEAFAARGSEEPHRERHQSKGQMTLPNACRHDQAITWFCEHFQRLMSLSEYAKKRDFTKTPEPPPDEAIGSDGRTGRFFVQRHDASHLHYDFRMEMNGTLKSWAVPKGPSLDPAVKHFAALVEDHPLDYGDFEGNIPKGEYGGGSVMLWDRGTFELIGDEQAEAQIARGDMKFRLFGEKLSGTWAIVYMKNRGKGNEWLLIKKQDEAAQSPWDIEEYAVSVKTGRTQTEIAEDKPAKKRVAMPGFFEPMGSTITDRIPKGDDWLYEVKWDGVRSLVFIDEGRVKIFTRNENRCEHHYPELGELAKYIKAKRVILDGELVVMDENGVSKFELIQPRIHTEMKAPIRNPVHLFVFDLLWYDGRDLRSETLAVRKELLKRIVKPWPLLRVSESFAGQGEELLEAAKASGLEGLMAKRAGSVYESRRSANWLKIKLTSEEEFVVGGYTPGERDYFGSLALGLYEDEQLRYAGNVGTGFTQKSLGELWKKLEPLKTTKNPFVMDDKIPRGTEWVEPKLVAQVKYANWTSDRKLRAPVFLGLRNDKPSVEVVVEKLIPETKLTNLNKIYYPEDGYTKGDVLHYYEQVAELILPHLKDRPLSLKRYPNGIHEAFFFQKNTPDGYPAWLRTEIIEGTRFVLAEDKRSLMYLANLGCIDQNPWMSRVGTLEHPDFVLIDLDPHECEFAKVVEAAVLVKGTLDKIGLKGYPKTTGGDGMHIYIPVKPVYTFEQVRTFAEVIARMLAVTRPELFTMPRSVAAREKNRVYFDYMQIASGKTISAPYVARAYPGAAVSTPLDWKEVTPELHPSQFHIKNAPARFALTGDLFEGVLRRPQDLVKAFGKLEKLIRH